jgi:hypothetical protein
MQVSPTGTSTFEIISEERKFSTQVSRSSSKDGSSQQGSWPTAALQELQSDGGEKKSAKTRFRMLANSGGIIEGHPFWGNFSIDLSGLKIGKQKKPALRDHDPQRIVGHTYAIEVTPDGLVAEGTFSNTPDGREVQEMLADGFPWQASVYVPPKSIERLAEGESAEVNGYTLHGPGHVFRESSLREVTFTTLGADEDTDAAQLSDSHITINAAYFSAAEPEEVFMEEDNTQDQNESEDTQVDSDSALAESDNDEHYLAGYESGIDDGLKSERDRVTVLLEASLSTQIDLVGRLIADGTGENDALKALLADAKETMEARLTHQLSSTPDPVGPVSSEDLEADLKSAFDADPELAAEFGSFEIWEAYMKASETGSIQPGKGD